MKETNEENIEELDEDEDIEGTARQLATDDEDDVEDHDEVRENKEASAECKNKITNVTKQS